MCSYVAITKMSVLLFMCLYGVFTLYDYPSYLNKAPNMIDSPCYKIDSHVWEECIINS